MKKGHHRVDEAKAKPERVLTAQKLKDRALDLLSRREHSRQELFRKLKDKGGNPDEITPLLAQLVDWGYLDDKRFAENFLRYRAGRPWGRDRFRNELLLRGVSAQIVGEVLDESELFRSDAVQGKLRLLVQRGLSAGKEPVKIAASLVRRGFRAQDVRRALEDTQDLGGF